MVKPALLVLKYNQNRGKYTVIVEASKQPFTVSPENLKRPDKTPDDCWHYIEYDGGKMVRHDFESKEDSQTFKASLEKAKQGLQESIPYENAEVEAAEAEVIAGASILTELDLEENDK